MDGRSLRILPALFALGLASCFSTAGQGDNGGSSGTSGGLSPTSACEEYLECVAVVTPMGLGPLLETYGPGGTCWQSTPDVAEQCDIACMAGLEQLQEAFPEEPVCSGSLDGGSESSGGTDSPVTERIVDILFVVDNSGSMGEEQAALGESVGELVSVLDGADPPIDFRIAVTTTDNGNPWCMTSIPDSGALRAVSCLDRSEEFVFEGAVEFDVFDEACQNVCSLPGLVLSDPWIEVSNTEGTTNVPGGEVIEAARCILPQGIDGCGFEQPLESMLRTIQRTELANDPAFGYFRPGALPAVFLVTDEVDCSHDPAHEIIFLPEGNRVFWSDATAGSPSSAACWNAGVACEGRSPYSSCAAANYDESGNPVSGSPESVLFSIDRYVATLTERAAYVAAIDGVGQDGSIVWADSLTDTQFQSDFGIGPGCSGAGGQAVPPVRVHDVIEAVSGPGNEWSICAPSYQDAMATFGQEILSRLP
ncbi:MAG: hypothetical protein AAGF11_23720 [Myxococcota bacterium]